MSLLMGIDVGTSSVKTLIMDERGNVKAISQQEYVFDIPQEGYAEQCPEQWWQSTVYTIAQALKDSGAAPADIAAVGLSGQMHGMVALDKDGHPVRPAIIWCDQRSRAEVEFINEKLGKEQLGKVMRSPIATGFQTASVLWLKNNEPENYDNTQLFLTPKDYIRYRLTGTLGSESSDAAGTLAYDTANDCWAVEILDKLGLNVGKYPYTSHSCDIAGGITTIAAEETGLSADTKVIFGASDQVMQAIGNGIISPGDISSTIGTGGQLYAPLQNPIYDTELRTHTFCGPLKGSWFIMGATLCAGLSLRWLRDNILQGISYGDMTEMARDVPMGSEGLWFLPYLSGERTPHVDPYARAMFFGLTLNHKRDHLMRSIMEGVVYSIRDGLEIYRGLGIAQKRIIASGGGARSDVWNQIQADVLNVPIYTSRMLEQACVGAAICAGYAAGIYGSLNEGCAAVIEWNDEPALPIPQNVEKYAKGYELYRSLYINNKNAMKTATLEV